MYVSRSRLAVSDNKGRSSRSMKGTTGGTLNQPWRCRQAFRPHEPPPKYLGTWGCWAVGITDLGADQKFGGPPE